MEIAFLGDTVNTAARVQEACKTYSRELIISGEVLDKLDLPADNYIVIKLGENKLRGKETPISLYSIELVKAIC